MKFLFGCCLVFSLLAGFVGLVRLLVADSLIEQCAVAGITMVWTVVPYCAARSCQELTRE